MVKAPFSCKTFNLAMVPKDEKQCPLDQFLNIDPPPFDPYSLETQLAATATGYDLSSLTIKIGLRWPQLWTVVTGAQMGKC
jgi:hypothetical protein